MKAKPAASEDRPGCTRCGECCRTSTPSLHLEDLGRVEKGDLAASHLYTVRVGERVRDNISGRLVFAPQELIKVREKGAGDGSCVYYAEDHRACRIYDRRPAQCAALLCRDPTAFLEVYRRPKATRADLFRDPALIRLMEGHERRCAYNLLSALVKDIPQTGRPAVENILKILRFDHDLRGLAVKRLGLDPSETDLLFGRPLAETIVMFGLEVRPEPDGSFLLTPLGPREGRSTAEKKGRAECSPPLSSS